MPSSKTWTSADQNSSAWRSSDTDSMTWNSGSASSIDWVNTVTSMGAPSPITVRNASSLWIRLRETASRGTTMPE